MGRVHTRPFFWDKMTGMVTHPDLDEFIISIERLRREGLGEEADKLLAFLVDHRVTDPRVVWAVWHSGWIYLLQRISEAEGAGGRLARALLALDRGERNSPDIQDLPQADRLRYKVWEALLTGGDALSAWSAYEPFSLQKGSDAALEVRVLLAAKDPARASARLQRAQLVDPRNGELLALSAVLLLNAKKLKEAERVLEKAVSSLPHDATVRTNRVRVMVARGDLEGAIGEARMALACRPWYDPPVQLIAKTLFGLRDFERLSEWIEEAIRFCPLASRLSARIDVLMMRGADPTTLIDAAESLLASHRDDPMALLSAGNAFARARELKRAIECYERRLSLVPDDVAVRANLAQLLWESGDIEGAVSMWDGLGGRCPPEALLNYGDALLRLGRLAESLNVYKRALEKDQNIARAWAGLARAYLGLGEIKQAGRAADTAISRDPSSPSGWLARADLLAAASGMRGEESVLLEGIREAKPIYPLLQRLAAIWKRKLKPVEYLRRIADWVERSPQDARLWVLLAEAARDARDRPVLEQSLSMAEKLDPISGGLAVIRIRLASDDLIGALKKAVELIERYPENIAVRKEAIQSFLRSGHFDEALSLAKSESTGIESPDKLEIAAMRLQALSHLERWEDVFEEAWRLVSEKPAQPLVKAWTEAAIALGKALEAYETARSRRGRVWVLAAVRLAEVLGKENEVVDLLLSAIHQSPEDLELQNRLMTLLARLGRVEEALARIDELSERLGEVPRMALARAEVLLIANRPEEAGKLLYEASERFPDSFEIHTKAAEAWRRAGDEESERKLTIKVVERFPVERWAEWLLPQAARLGLTKVLEDALQHWHESEPGNPTPLWLAYRYNAGERRFPLALEQLSHIEKRAPSDPELWRARALSLSEMWRMDEAILAAKKAFELAPSSSKALLDLLNIQAKAGDFSGFDETWKKLALLLGPKRYTRHESFFFAINCHPTLSAQEIYRFYEEWYRNVVLPNNRPYRHWDNSPDPDRRLKIGYFSPDFRRHAVAYFSEPWLIEHDRDQFEIYAFAELKPGQADKWTARFRSYVHHWINTHGLTNREIAELVRRLGIDIIIDLAGHTDGNRLGVFALKPAPVQASVVFGAGQTTGLPQVDWFVADAFTCPPEHEPHMAEKVWRLPKVGLPYCPPDDALEPTPLPCLRKSEIILGVMCRPIRLSEAALLAWSEILHLLPEARLRFDHVPYESQDVQNRLRAFFTGRGISPDRIEFRNTRPHWKAYQEIDLYLDTFPAGSGTTVTESLWMGRPAVSLASRPIMGRIGGAQLIALGLDGDCLAWSEEEYVNKTVELCRERDRMREIATGLRERFRQSYLMDYKRYADYVASSIRVMWKIWCGEQ
ncbi:MAG: tetratricopeptide repeat protein [Candidatus Methanomethyliaceae archaeon]